MKTELKKELQEYVDTANDNAAFMDEKDWGHQVGFLLSAKDCEDILLQIEAKDKVNEALIQKITYLKELLLEARKYVSMYDFPKTWEEHTKIKNELLNKIDKNL